MSDLIPSEESIHKMYSDLQKQRQDDLLRHQAIQNAANPTPLTGRQAYHSNASRFTSPSFRSQFFNVGEGLITVAKGQTVVVARKTVPAHHAGVLTGFSQYFSGCDAEPDIINSVVWGLRINGLTPNGLQDFVGSFSSLSFPHSVYFPLSGGAESLGLSSISQGGSSALDNTPTVYLQATNNWKTNIVLQGRVVGYTVPTAERNDEFSAI